MTASPTGPMQPGLMPADAGPSIDAHPLEGRLEGRRHVPLPGARQQFEPWAEIVVAGSILQRSGAAGRFTLDVARARVDAWPDGRRTLIADDGRTLTIEPTLWRDGRRLVHDIDRAADPGRTSQMPAREPSATPAPLSAGQQAGQAFGEGRVRVRRVALLTAGVLLIAAAVTLPFTVFGAAVPPATTVASPSIPASAAASPAADQRWDNAYLSMWLPADWKIDDYGINIRAEGPTRDERILVSSIDEATQYDLDEMLRRNSACPSARKQPTVVVSGRPADTLDCTWQGRNYRVFTWHWGHRLTQVTYSASTAPEQSEALQLFLAKLIVHIDPTSRGAMNGPAADGPRVAGPGFALYAPSGFKLVKNGTAKAVVAAGFPTPFTDDKVLGVFTNPDGGSLLAAYHPDSSYLNPIFHTWDRSDTAIDADHDTYPPRVVDAKGGFAYLFDDEDPEGRSGFVLVTRRGEGFLTLWVLNPSRDKAWDDLLGVVNSLS